MIPVAITLCLIGALSLMAITIGGVSEKDNLNVSAEARMVFLRLNAYGLTALALAFTAGRLWA